MKTKKKNIAPNECSCYALNLSQIKALCRLQILVPDGYDEKINLLLRREHTENYYFSNSYFKSTWIPSSLSESEMSVSLRTSLFITRS